MRQALKIGMTENFIRLLGYNTDQMRSPLRKLNDARGALDLVEFTDDQEDEAEREAKNNRLMSETEALAREMGIVDDEELNNEDDEAEESAEECDDGMSEA